MKYFGKISEFKKKSTDIDLVTIADIESEDFIIEEIKKKYPDHTIESEETGLTIKGSEYKWIIDPLDGTTNFTHNIPIFAVSIALKKNNRTICGVVYNPAAKRCFSAEINKGAFLNDKEIKTTSCSTLSESLIVTGFPYIHDARYDISFEIFKDFYDITRGVRRLGSASLDLCFVAMGRFEGYYEFELKPWDICAGALIAIEAGARVTDWDNQEMPETGSRILASNGNLHNKMVSILNKKKYRKIFR